MAGGRKRVGSEEVNLALAEVEGGLGGLEEAGLDGGGGSEAVLDDKDFG